MSRDLNGPLRSEVEQEEHWVAVSDLMGGLMMVFLLIAVIYMVQLEIEARKIRSVVLLYERLRTQIYDDLVREFGPDLPRWGAEIDRDLSMSFYNTEVLFEQGEADIRPGFRQILDDFFPRYVAIITSDKYREDIVEVRIEGHTSSDWGAASGTDDAYINNMALSQARTRTTAAYLLTQAAVLDKKDWLKRHLTANGLSSSKLVIGADGMEDGVRSRRVEFRLRTDADARMAALLKDL